MVRADPDRVRARAGPRPRLGDRRGRDAAAARVPAAVRPPRRHLARPRGLGRQAAHDLGRAGRRPRRPRRRRRRPRRRRRHVAEGVPLQPGPERHGRHLADPAQPHRHPHPGAARPHDSYDLPDVIQVEADGPIRIVRLNRPEQLNATNHELHAGLAALFPQLDADPDARVAVHHRQRPGLLGRRRLRLHRRAHQGRRRSGTQTLTHGRQIVTGMVACRVPVVAAVNGPAVGLGCSLVALSDIVLHGRERPPRRPARAGRPGRRRRRPGHVAAAHQPPAGQGVRAHRRPHPGAAGGRDRPGQPRVPRRRGARPGPGVRPAASPSCPSGPPRTPSASSTCTSSGPCWPRSTSR